MASIEQKNFFLEVRKGEANDEKKMRIKMRKEKSIKDEWVDGNVNRIELQLFKSCK